MAEYYKDERWREKKLKKYTCCYLTADTVLMEDIDGVYSKDAWGALWRNDKQPSHLERPSLPGPDFSGFVFPTSEPFVANILRQKEQAIQAYNGNTEQYRVIHMGWGIFEHTWRMRGFENALVDMIEAPDFYRELTRKITDIYIDMLKACADIPNDAYIFGDDWGEQRGLIMGRARWCEFLKPSWARVYAEVHRQGKKAVQHSCGSIVDIYDDLAEIEMDCHESVQPEARGMAPEALKEKFGRKVSFWGCLGSQGLLFSGTPAAIQAEVFRLHHLFREDGGFVLMPAKPLQDGMAIERAVAAVEAFQALG